MTDPASAVPTIAPSDKPLLHRWGEPVTMLTDTPSGCEETERVCLACRLTKITVHPPNGLPWRAWRTVGGTRTDKIGATPPCTPSGNVESLAGAPAEVRFT
jgi:hypothetical protein